MAARRPPAPAFTLSKSGSHGGALLIVALAIVAVGLLLLGMGLGPLEASPWPQPARVLVELRGEITFAGLGILAACSAAALILLFVS